MAQITKEKNIILIGMPGVGKSTIGVLLAKETSRSFLDTDVYIQTREGRKLQEIIDAEGLEFFCKKEQLHILGIDRRSSVIATGGSVVYSEPAMEHLKTNGIIVLMDIDLDSLKNRLTDISYRGVVIEPGETFEALYSKRMPLYHRYADITIKCKSLNHEQVVKLILNKLDLN